MDGLDGCLKKLLKGKINRDKYFTSYLQFHWKNIMGENMSKKSYPCKVIDKKLFLDVTSSSWAHNFFTMKNEIIRKINDEFNDILVIDDIQFVTKGKIKHKEILKLESSEEIILPELDSVDIINIKKTVEKIKDEKLYEKMSSVISKDIQTKKYYLQKGFPTCQNFDRFGFATVTRSITYCFYELSRWNHRFRYDR